jgi:hypothetical protein
MSGGWHEDGGEYVKRSYAENGAKMLNLLKLFKGGGR